MKVVIGMDCGGSKTHARIAALGDGRLIEERFCPGWGTPGDDEAAPLPELDAFLRDAIRAAGGEAVAVCANLGGKNENQFRRVLAGVCPGARIAVFRESAGVIARLLGEGERAQAVLLAGTGAIALAWNAAARQEVVCGGWGQDVGDQGSGYWIGLEGLKAAFAALDGWGAPTLLCRALLDEDTPLAPCAEMTTLMRQRDEIRSRLMPLNRRKVAALTPAVADCAAQGDPAAREIFRQAGCALAEIVGAAARKVALHTRPGTVLVMGGLLRAGDHWMPGFTATLRDRLPGWDARRSGRTLAEGAEAYALTLARTGSADGERNAG